MSETLLGENMPLKCSESRKNSEQLLEQIYISDSNLFDIEQAQQTWSKYWPFLATDNALLAMEEKVLQPTRLRRHIAGPSKVHPILSYRICGEEFTKPIEPSEVEAIKKHHASDKKYIVPLLKVDGKHATMKNVLAGLDPRVICNIVLHQTIFEASTIEEHEDNVALGNPIYELAYYVKELIDMPERQHLRLNERRPTIRNHGDLLSKLLGAADSAAKLLEALKEVSSFDLLQENTGYNLLLVQDAADRLNRVFLINPHPLPKPLQISKDGMVNSRTSFESAMAALQKMIGRCSKASSWHK